MNLKKQSTVCKIYPDVNPDLLLEELGIEPNNEKIKFYILLDELF